MVICENCRASSDTLPSNTSTLSCPHYLPLGTAEAVGVLPGGPYPAGHWHDLPVICDLPRGAHQPDVIQHLVYLQKKGIMRVTFRQRSTSPGINVFRVYLMVDCPRKESCPTQTNALWAVLRCVSQSLEDWDGLATLSVHDGDRLSQDITVCQFIANIMDYAYSTIGCALYDEVMG